MLIVAIVGLGVLGRKRSTGLGEGGHSPESASGECALQKKRPESAAGLGQGTGFSAT